MANGKTGGDVIGKLGESLGADFSSPENVEATRKANLKLKPMPPGQFAAAISGKSGDATKNGRQPKARGDYSK
jgi:hypothetical protein